MRQGKAEYILRLRQAKLFIGPKDRLDLDITLEQFICLREWKRDVAGSEKDVKRSIRN